MAKLQIEIGAKVLKKVRLDGNLLAIGSAPENQLQLDDPSVAPLHAILMREEGEEEGYFVTDQSSWEGICLNGVKVEEAKLKNGDVIQIGIANLRFLTSEKPVIPETVPAAQDPGGSASEESEVMPLVEPDGKANTEYASSETDRKCASARGDPAFARDKKMWITLLACTAGVAILGGLVFVFLNSPNDSPASPSELMPSEQTRMAAGSETRAPEDEALVTAPEKKTDDQPLLWTDASGQHHTKATFLRLDNGIVHLRKPNGDEITVPLDRLNAASRIQAHRLRAAA